jgi:tRNA G37 N-methylase TrmD
LKCYDKYYQARSEGSVDLSGIELHERTHHKSSVPDWHHYGATQGMAMDLDLIRLIIQHNMDGVSNPDAIRRSAVAQSTHPSSIAYITPGGQAIERGSMHDWMLNPNNQNFFFADTNGNA